MRMISTGCSLGLLFAVALAGCGDSATSGSNDGGTSGTAGGNTAGSGGSATGTGGSGTGGDENGSGGSMSGSGGTASGTGGSGGGSDTCHKLCDKGEALNCPMDTKGECASQCAASPAKCSTQLNALAACAQTITYMCVDGEATPDGCDTEFGAYLQCVLSQ